MTRVLDPAWIPMADGTRLAARIWIPESAREQRYPAILEAIPYRRRDGTLTIDEPRYSWWAERGLAGVRVDLRGSGDSEGLLYDEYLRQEQDDDLAVIEWIAAQPWCNGRVGMIGYSWGGFAGLQVAARRPAPLGAVVTVNSTVRRYTDDCHYTGGAVNAHDMLSWATTMLAFDTRPPDPAVVGERWRELWERRLDVAPPMIEHWLSHQLEDAYWRHGSVAFDYDAIAAPVLAVGGWSDPYRNAVLELLEHLRGPCFGLIGPWAHGYPHATLPGPQVAFLDECARFFGRYLRDDDNCYERTPPLRAYLQSFDRPAAFQERRSGRWLSLPAWPPPTVPPLTLSLGDRVLAPAPADTAPAPADTAPTRPDGVPASATPAPPQAATTIPMPAPLELASTQSTGLAAGSWCPYGGPTQPLDQRADDAGSLCFDSAALAAPVEVLGFPLLRLRLAADRPRALLSARLCDVSPTGESLLVTRAILNLSHRHGHAAPELRLDCAGHRFELGHRIRLALSPTYWPWIWPSPEPVTLSIAAGSGTLELPRLGEHEAAELGAAETTASLPVEWIVRSPSQQRVTRELAEGTIVLSSQPDFLAGRCAIAAIGLEVEDWGENRYLIEEGRPLSAEVRCRRRAGLRREGWDVRIEADARMRASATEFHVETELRAFEDGALVATRSFDTRVARAD